MTNNRFEGPQNYFTQVAPYSFVESERKGGVVAVTGGLQGIGLKIADCFAEHGFDVVIADIGKKGNFHEAALKAGREVVGYRSRGDSRWFGQPVNYGDEAIHIVTPQELTGTVGGWHRLNSAEGHNDELARIKPEEIEVVRLDPHRVAAIYQTDSTRQDQVRATVADIFTKYGGIDVLINNAGTIGDNNMECMTDEQYRRVFEVNFFGAVNWTKHVLPVMISQWEQNAEEAGCIVYMGSVSGEIGNYGQGNYAPSKSANASFARVIATEEARHKIRTVTINPGFTETEMTEKIPYRIKKKIMDKTPRPRFGSPENVAKIVFSAATNPDITGTQIDINNGLYMN